MFCFVFIHHKSEVFTAKETTHNCKKFRNDLRVTTILQEAKKTLPHLTAEAHCASQPPGNHPTPRATLQQKAQTALS